MSAASIAVTQRADGGREVILGGRWTLAMIAAAAGAQAQELAAHAQRAGTSWNCLDIEALDSAGAMLLWRAWGRALPPALRARPEQLRVFARIADSEKREHRRAPLLPWQWLYTLGSLALALRLHLVDFLALLGQLVLDLVHLARLPGELPKREISANIYKSGVRAMPVTALVGFLIGIALSYLSALQLKQFGADIYIVNLLGMGLIRELGPVLVSVLVAGRSGSAITAQLGVMRVTEEIDALATMGVSRSLRLIFPKVVALGLTVPLLVLWTTAIALVGGMVAANIQLDLGYAVFLHELPKAVPVANVWLALAKGLTFGIFIALVACHFGLRVRPNTESLSTNTTASVVTAITVVILIDALFAIATRDLGMPEL